MRANSEEELEQAIEGSASLRSTPDDTPTGELPLVIEIPGKPPSLNDFYSGMHWAQRNKTKDRWHEKVGLYAPDVQVETYPVAVECIVFWGEGRRYDAENVVMASKLVTDGLIMAGVLEDDGPKQIRRVALEARRMEDDGHLTRYTITKADTP